jgi:hypothetical protein
MPFPAEGVPRPFIGPNRMADPSPRVGGRSGSLDPDLDFDDRWPSRWQFEWTSGAAKYEACKQQEQSDH